MKDLLPESKRVKVYHDEHADDIDTEIKPKRRLASFFGSNQNIQRIAAVLAAQSQESELQGSENIVPQHEICHPPFSTSTRKYSDDIEVIQDTVTNACSVLPHPRHICGVYPFDASQHKSFCEKCYCYVCQIPASECQSWEKSHCDAADTDIWQRARQLKKTENITSNDDSSVIILQDSDEEDNPSTNNHSSPSMTGNNLDDPFRHHFDDSMKDLNDLIGQKPRKDSRITEVLAYNLRRIDNEINAKISTIQRAQVIENDKMSGDIPQLNLQNSFFVEGVRIGWPYPVIMPPQRQMAIHLTKAFKNSRHVVIESPTGTGKSAAILCSALAWQRFHSKTSPMNDVVKIIYCSRTHSQVGQMVSSLKKTPYRPRMAILGSRERLCIHKKLRPRSKVIGSESTSTFDNVNLSCQIRTQNVESYRKSKLRQFPVAYDDDSPPASHPGDTGEKQTTFEDDEDVEEESRDRMESDAFQTCPHYRQLTNLSVAKKIHSIFVPDPLKVNCCSHGGDRTKFGAHDIEDLIQVGMNPNIRRGISLYRDPSTVEFGFKMHQNTIGHNTISVSFISPDGAADKEGSLSMGDMILAVNGIDTSKGHNLNDVAERITRSVDPLMLDVYSGENENIDTDEYADDSFCPYYASKVLSKSANLIFCPYNYILDPDIRAAMEIDIANTVIVLDEAHNVEDTLRSLGSDKFKEFEVLKMLAFLSFFAAKWIPLNQRLNNNLYGSSEDEELKDRIPETCHFLLLFLEKIIILMRTDKEKFENNLINIGVTRATEEYEKFKSPDDKEFEVRYFGPNGSGDGKKPIGCSRFFESVGVTKDYIDVIVSHVNDVVHFMSSNRGNPIADERRKLAERLSKFINILCSALRNPEHYYISTSVTANGNLDFATGKIDNGDGTGNLFKKNPKSVPKVSFIENQHHPRPCRHPTCNRIEKGTISHECLFDGSTPRWESVISINVLTPGILMAPILREARSVVLASGSLAPLDSLCAELHLLGPNASSSSSLSGSNRDFSGVENPVNDSTSLIDEMTRTDPLSTKTGRLQVQPKPLEANHIIDLSKQLLAVSIGNFLDGSPLSVKMSQYSRPGFYEKLGDAIATIVEGIPKGGVLIFVPSFSFLRKCVATWEHSNVWRRLLISKGDVVVEPNGQHAFEKARDQFNRNIETAKKCILLAVFRGKMSEGVSFNDDYARGVICVGVPLPNSYERSTSAKMAYNNEQRRFRNKQVLGGNEWYNQQAYRALAQAIGRCIRHSADYGTIVFLDSRHCDDGQSSYYESGTAEAHKNLPKWMRHAVKTLRQDHEQIGRNDILGGWAGLKSTMKAFFEQAAIYSVEVINRQREDFERSLKSTALSQILSVDGDVIGRSQ